MTGQGRHDDPPTFTVVVPTYRRPAHLLDCIEGVSRLEYPRERFELIVVDDAYDDSSAAIVKKFLERLDIDLVRQRHSGPGAARNAGAARGRGELIAFTDDDCVPAPDWLRAVARVAARNPRSAVGGTTLNAVADNVYSIASQVVVDAVHAHYRHRRGRFFASSNVAFPSEEFRALGGFDPSFRHAEDRELCDRWSEAALPMVAAPDAVVLHHRELSVREYWGQHVAYGRGAGQFHRVRHGRRLGSPALSPRFYARLLAGARRSGVPRRGTQLVPLLALSQIANLAGFVLERRLREIDTK